MKLALQCLVGTLVAGIVIAGPVTTVPWNGYSGAVSFTFDDGCQSQLDNVIPALRSRNIHATFFLYDVGASFSNRREAWVAAAREGNELGNHSLSHADFSKAINASNEVSEMASLLRGADSSIQSVTFAYPYCAIGYESVVGAENIIGRGCMFAAPFQPLRWSSPPTNWNNVGAIYIGDDATAGDPSLAALDAARNSGWITTLIHGVGGDWAVVATDLVLALFDRAIQNGLWVGTYQDVAAYWRAGLTLDAVHPVSSGSGWQLSWSSPHPKMPKSVRLKIRLDTTVFGNEFQLYQNGAEVLVRAEGFYEIEFMDLAMEVRRRIPVVQTPYKAMEIPGTIQMEDYDLGGEGVAYHDMDAVNSGNIYRQDGVDIESDGNGGYNLGWTEAGEWTEYTVDVTSDATYFEARVATDMDSCGFHLEIDGADVTGEIKIANTGGWGNYRSINGTIQSLTQGSRTLRLVIDRSYCNIDWIQFDSESLTTNRGTRDLIRKEGHYKVYDLNGKLEKMGSKPVSKRVIRPR